MDNEMILLRGMCAVAAKRLLDRSEMDFHSLGKKKCADYEIRLMDYSLCSVPFDSSAKRLSLAKKLQDKGLITLSQHRKGGIWSYKFSSQELTQKIYDEAFELLSKFEIKRGNGFTSYPQFTYTKAGSQEIDRLGLLAFDSLSDMQEVEINE